VTGNAVVLGVALLTWVLLFVYLLRIERRVKDMERR
jgi:CcmD family protein